MTADDRAREVAASGCDGGCEMCRDYIETGLELLRPTTQEERAAMIASRTQATS